MKKFTTIFAAFLLSLSMVTTIFAAAANASQITNAGGTTENQADNIKVSKTIEGTDIENVFDITLKVETTSNAQQVSKDPDVAIVVVMDVSNSMVSEFGNKRRYEAAVEALKTFIDSYQQNTKNSATSNLGIVAFNTDAMQYAAMQKVTTTAQATTLKNSIADKTLATMKKYYKNGVNGFGGSDFSNDELTYHRRFTNIEAGLKRGYDMIKNLSNKNKMIVFLSDGFPTTYIKSGYAGYDTYTPNATSYTEGKFYDAVLKVPCTYGTSYSDRAAKKASAMAKTIKAANVEIHSIGIDVGGQTITGYDIHPSSDGFSVIDRSSRTYEIGSATSATAFENWLKGTKTTGIGSGHYYGTTNQTQLTNAFKSIFNALMTAIQTSSTQDWQVKDPMGTNIEFVGFFNKNGTLQQTSTNLSGTHTGSGENTATFTTSNKSINWNVQESGYKLANNVYTYTLKYRVRLTNEAASGFTSGTSYNTNGKTTLTYKTITTTDGNSVISDPKEIEFKKPAVKGYLAPLTFKKVDQFGRVVAGATFELTHDTANCKTCKGSNPNGSVALTAKTATSNAQGQVSFTNIPSGHKYLLKETGAPTGYSVNQTTYHVTIAYGQVTETDLPNNQVTDPMDEYQIKLKKIDGTSQQVLSGAAFKVYSDSQMTTLAKHPDGSEIGDITTSDDGIANLGILDFNKTYYLKETKAPDGYEKLINSVNITISLTADNKVTATNGSTNLPVTKENGTALIYIVTVKNTPGAALPETGGPGTARFVEAGIGFMALAMILLWIKRRELLNETH